MGKFRFFQCIWYTCCSDEFGRIYRSSTDSENHVLEAHLIKFVETPMDSTGFLFFFFMRMWWYVRPAGIMIYLSTTRSVVFTDRRPILTENESWEADLIQDCKI